MGCPKQLMSVLKCLHQFFCRFGVGAVYFGRLLYRRKHFFQLRCRALIRAAFFFCSCLHSLIRSLQIGMFLFQYIIAALEFGDILFQLRRALKKRRFFFGKSAHLCAGLRTQGKPAFSIGGVFRSPRCCRCRFCRCSGFVCTERETGRLR